MTLKTRKLTGRPPWPITLLAGSEKTGKTWAAVAASSSDLIGHTLWFPIGEDDPDEYKQIPGFDEDRFDLVLHDGSYRGLLGALEDAANFQDRNGKPTLWVLDSGTRLWDLLSGMAQLEANARWARKHNGRQPDEDVTIGVDLWTTAGDRWGYVFDEFRAHQGPGLWTARMESTVVVDGRGEPTKERTQKILAQKRLPYDVGAIVEMPSRGEAWLTGVRSVKLAQAQPRVKLPDFTVDALWRKLGLADEPAGHRTFAAIDPDDKPAAAAETAREELRALCEERGWEPAKVAAAFADLSEGVALRDSRNPLAIRAFTEQLKKDWAKVQIAKTA